MITEIDFVQPGGLRIFSRAHVDFYCRTPDAIHNNPLLLHSFGMPLLAAICTIHISHIIHTTHTNLINHTIQSYTS